MRTNENELLGCAVLIGNLIIFILINCFLLGDASHTPVFVSVGNRLSLQRAVEATLACTGGFKIVEPIRQVFG